LLLVIYHLLAVPVSVLWVGFGNKLVTKKYLDVRTTFAGWHILRVGGDALRGDPDSIPSIPAMAPHPTFEHIL
jgi:hypothetical protein